MVSLLYIGFTFLGERLLSYKKHKSIKHKKIHRSVKIQNNTCLFICIVYNDRHKINNVTKGVTSMNRNLFYQAHTLCKATLRKGDSYSATFALCLAWLYKKLKKDRKKFGGEQGLLAL